MCAEPLPLEQQFGQGFGQALVLSSRWDHLQLSVLHYLFRIVSEACYVEMPFYSLELSMILRGILSQMAPCLRELLYFGEARE